MGVMPLLTKHESNDPLPVDDPGDASALLAIQNVSGQLDNFSVHYLGQGGYPESMQAASGVRSHASKLLWGETLPVPAGWIGSAALNGVYSAPPAAAAFMTWNSGLTGSASLNTTGAAYSSPESGTTLYFPYATLKPVRDASGRHGRFSILTLMNTGQSEASFLIDLLGSTSLRVSDTLRMNESRSYNLAAPGDPVGSQLGGGLAGSHQDHVDWIDATTGRHRHHPLGRSDLVPMGERVRGSRRGRNLAICPTGLPQRSSR